MITQEIINTLIEAGTLAPSVDNCQPWLFTSTGDSIVIFLDKQRAEFFGDYQFAASYVTLGAVVENITIAAAGHGLGCAVEYFPASADQCPVARLTLSESTVIDTRLTPYLAARCTSRAKYQRRTLADESMARFKEVTPVKGATLYLFDDRETMTELYHLSSAIDAIIFSHPELHANLFKWIRWSQGEKEETKDGMPIDCLGLEFLEQLFFRFISSWHRQQVANRVGINKLIGVLNSRLLLHASCLGFVVMDGSSRQDYLEGGRYFQRIWLTAAAQQLSLQPFGGLPFLLTRLLHAGGEGFSKKQYSDLQHIADAVSKIIPIDANHALVAFFRLGYGPPVTGRTIRRQLSEITQS